MTLDPEHPSVPLALKLPADFKGMSVNPDSKGRPLAILESYNNDELSVINLEP